MRKRWHARLQAGSKRGRSPDSVTRGPENTFTGKYDTIKDERSELDDPLAEERVHIYLFILFS